MTDNKPTNKKSPEPELTPKQKFNLETGKLDWQEIQTHFARGVVIVVNQGLDLIDVAVKLSDDNAKVIEQLIDTGDIVRAHDDHARSWVEKEPSFWAVVVSPWVLVQEIKESPLH